jgi:hypothetical protein
MCETCGIAHAVAHRKSYRKQLALIDEPEDSASLEGGMQFARKAPVAVLVSVLFAANSCAALPAATSETNPHSTGPIAELGASSLLTTRRNYVNGY